MTNRILPPGNVLTHFNEKTAQDETIYGQTPISRNRLVRVYGDFVSANISGIKEKIVKIENPNARYDWNPTRYVKFFWDAHTLTAYTSGSDVHEWVDSKSNVMLSASSDFPRFSDNPLHGVGTTKPWCVDFKSTGTKVYLNSVTTPPIGPSDTGPISLYFVGRYWHTTQKTAVFKFHVSDTNQIYFTLDKSVSNGPILGIRLSGGFLREEVVQINKDVGLKPYIFCWTKDADAGEVIAYAKEIGSADPIGSVVLDLATDETSLALSNPGLYSIARVSSFEYPYYFMTALLVYGEYHSSEDVSTVMSFLEAKYNI